MSSKVCVFIFGLNVFLMFAGFAAEESAKDISSKTGVKGGPVGNMVTIAERYAHCRYSKLDT